MPWEPLRQLTPSDLNGLRRARSELRQRAQLVREQTAELRRNLLAIRAHIVGAIVAAGRSSRGARQAPGVYKPAAASPTPLDGQLTRRMREILTLLIRGHSEKDVATALGLSRHTVHIHVTRMYQRLGVRSRAELLALAYRTGHVRVTAASPTEGADDQPPRSAA
jgi:DNA-binding NarL/FixJ family response regulator